MAVLWTHTRTQTVSNSSNMIYVRFCSIFDQFWPVDPVITRNQKKHTKAIQKDMFLILSPIKFYGVKTRKPVDRNQPVITP